MYQIIAAFAVTCFTCTIVRIVMWQNKVQHDVSLFAEAAVIVSTLPSSASTPPQQRDLAFGASYGQNSTLGLNTCGFLPVFNLHPLGSPVSYPASLQQAEAITCYVNLICSHTRLILSTSRESHVRVVQLWTPHLRSFKRRGPTCERGLTHRCKGLANLDSPVYRKLGCTRTPNFRKGSASTLLM